MTPGLRVRCEIFLWRHGWLWPLVAALWLAAWTLDHHARQAASQTARLEFAVRALPAAPAREAAVPPPRHAFPLPAEIAAAPDVTAAVERMLALAQAAGIELAQADYQHAGHPALQLTQTQIAQPLRASYPQLRRYLESVLRELPHASLDQVSARRDTVAQGQLEVRLKWSLWGPAPASAPPTGNAKGP
jgi:hypothetical protein